MNARRLAAMVPLITLAVALSGCSFLPYGARPRPRIENPRADLREFVLADFDGVPAAGDPAEWQRSVQGQLLDVTGIERILVPFSPDDPALSPAPGRAFLALAVLHFDPYYPPEAIVEVVLDSPAAPREGEDELGELDRMGRETFVSTRAASAPLRFQLRVDADDARIADDLVVFAHAQLDGDRGHEPIDRVLRDSSRFIDFVSYLALKESFRRLALAGGTHGESTEEGNDGR